MFWNIQSNLCTTATLGTPKKRPLFRGGRYLEGPPIKLVWIWDVWGSGWPLLTGGRYSEVAVSTGLTVLWMIGRIQRQFAYVSMRSNLYLANFERHFVHNFLVHYSTKYFDREKFCFQARSNMQSAIQSCQLVFTLN